MLLGDLLVDGSGWCLSVTASDLLSLPNEVLDQITLIFRQQEDFGLLNDVAKVGYEQPALLRQLVRGLRQYFRFKCTV